ncbi:hypothetical protein PMI07_006376 [Rhizobium sp. CF080]|nr:hypothetical protein PMI07_006376 [Rhizobium sp. CF080]
MAEARVASPPVFMFCGITHRLFSLTRKLIGRAAHASLLSDQTPGKSIAGRFTTRLIQRLSMRRFVSAVATECFRGSDGF